MFYAEPDAIGYPETEAPRVMRDLLGKLQGAPVVEAAGAQIGAGTTGISVGAARPGEVAAAHRAQPRVVGGDRIPDECRAVAQDEGGAGPVHGRRLLGDGGSFWAVAKKGAEDAGKRLGVTVKYSESANDPQKQAQLIDSAVTEKVDETVATTTEHQNRLTELEQRIAAMERNRTT